MKNASYGRLHNPGPHHPPMKTNPSILRKASVLSLGVAACIPLFFTSCSQNYSAPGSALNISNQDTSATVPGNSPIIHRMGADGTGQHRSRTTTTTIAP